MLLSLHRLLERRSLKRASCSAGRSPTLPSGQSSTTAAIERAEAEGGKDAVTVAQWQAILHVLDRAGLEFTRGGVRRKATAPDRAV